MAGFDLLAAGLAIFFLIHFVSGFYELRSRLVGLMGVTGYRAAHSLFAIGGLTLIVIGFSESPFEPLWQPPAFSGIVALIVMPVAIIFMIGGLVSKDILRITRHPMLWGLFLFSAVHLFANGELAPVMIFASFMVYSLLALWLTERKMRLGDRQGWEKLSAVTSVIPFKALIEGRALPAAGDRGLKAVLLGLGLFAALAYSHFWIAGVELPIARVLG